MKAIKKLLALGVSTLILSSTLLIASAEAPTVVENLQAFPGDGEVTLSWDPATDDEGVEGYNVYIGLNSVEAIGEGFYTFGAVDAEDNTTFTAEELSNDVTYFFAVTAYDENNDESEFYSNEVSATPTEGAGGDTTAPTVLDADAVTSSLVEVQFSEDVVLPEDGSTAFSIESTDGTPLEVIDAYVSTDDASIVVIVTADQDADSDYILTAGIDIMDEEENPVVSGTSDTALFKGMALGKESDDEDDEPEDDPDTVSNADVDFFLEGARATSETEIMLTFSKEVEEADPDSFRIEEENNEFVTIDIIAVSIDTDDATLVKLLVEEMDAGEDYIIFADDSVLTENDFTLSDEDEDREADFSAPTLDIADIIAPEDVSNFLASIVDETTAKLSWSASLNTANDLANYLLYRSVDGGVNFGEAMTLASTLTEYDVTGLTPGETYTFKVTAIDFVGNESDGILATVTLPETGPGMIALVGLSLAGAGAATRRRRED